MADTSFYGGRPGFSCVLVTYYRSIEEMVECFQQGPDYEAVHFNECVLINTKNKNHVDNGKIFRRGYDYTNDLGGAIYLGTIVGPMGPAPMVEMTTVDEVVGMQPESGYSYRFSEGEYAPLYNLVPGKTDDGEFRDSIKWACCSMRDESDLDVTAYIGFIFPYLVVDYESNSVSPYYNRDSEEAGFTNTDLVDRMDDESHPYWEKWHISVPKGIKGDTFENFRVIVATDDDNVEPYNGQDDDRANGREILVYDYYHFDKEEGGEPVTIYLGDYNMITGITIDDDGTITIEYSHDDTLQYPNLFKWIKSIELDTTNGHFTIIYNYDTEADGTPTKYETDLAWVSAITMTHEGKVTIHHITGDSEDLDEVIKWIDEVTLDEDGTIGIHYNTGEEVYWNNVLKWITEVELTDDGDFHISFNNGDVDYTTHLTWVNDITFEDDGTISVHYNDSLDDFTYKNLIQWITNISLEENGHFTVSFNNGTEDYETDLVWVRNLELAEDGTLTITFNNGEQVVYNNELKWITEVGLTDDGDFHISFNNGDEDYTTHLTWVNDITFEQDGTITVHYNDGTDDFTYKNLIQWITNISLEENGHFTVSFNNGTEDYETDLVWVRNLELAEDGTVTVTFNNGEQTIYQNELKWITEVGLTDDGDFHISFNNGDEDYTSHLTWINDITFGQDGTITVHYNDGTDDFTYKNLIQWVTEVSLAEDGHFTMSFNNGTEDYETDLIWVREITFEEDGIVTVTYNNGDVIQYPNIKWITNIELSETGEFHIDFNNGDEYDSNLTWVRDIITATDGTVTIEYNNGEQTVYNNLIQWITNVSLNEEGHLTVSFNNGAEDYETDLIWVTNLEMDEQGYVKMTFNNGVEETWDNQLKWITQVQLTDNGQFTISFNDSTQYQTSIVWVRDISIDPDGTITVTYNNEDQSIQSKYLKSITDVSINTEDGEGNQKVHITYNTGDEEDIGDPLNYIMEMAMVDSDYHLLIWYSDPAKRQEIIDEGKSYTYKDKDGWLDLGSVKDESGILIGFNIDQEVVSNIFVDTNVAIEYLNQEYPNGLTGVNLQGKVVTIGTDTEEKKFYAYDYDLDTWYYVGTIGNTIDNIEHVAMVASDSDTNLQTEIDNLMTGGFWFYLEE